MNGANSYPELDKLVIDALKKKAKEPEPAPESKPVRLSKN